MTIQKTVEAAGEIDGSLDVLQIYFRLIKEASHSGVVSSGPG